MGCAVGRRPVCLLWRARVEWETRTSCLALTALPDGAMDWRGPPPPLPPWGLKLAMLRVAIFAVAMC